MKITVLVENTSLSEELCCEHGLSLYIEACGKKILFDFGQSDLCCRNADALGIDLSQVDLAILSHGHYDHSGGIQSFLSQNTSAPVYVSKNAFGDHYNASGSYIGLDATLQMESRLVFAESIQQLAPGITLRSCNHQEPLEPIRSYGLRCGEKADVFDHEQYLIIEENGKRICISGCSHKGIVNIVNWLSPDVLIGGFHFMKLDPGGKELAEAGRWLHQSPAVYYT